MSIQRITKDNIENFTLYTYPTRTYTSSSHGITGSILLFARDNRILKDATPSEDYGEGVFGTAQIEDTRRSVIGAAETQGANIEGGMAQYMDAVSAAPASPLFNKRLEVTRFTPGVKFTKDTLRKSVTKNVLFPYYRPMYPCLNWGFTNYHTLNFFTASSVPSNSALIYPAGTGSAALENYFPYSPPGSFTFEFYINPRYKNESEALDFKAGTILHLSSSYCISLISGSARDINGLVDSYRIMLQLSHSADIAPSTIAPSVAGFETSLGSGFRPDLIFTSSDIPYNEWRHVALRWEAPSTGSVQTANQYTGSFVIDGVLDTVFAIPSASLIPQSFTNPQGDPDALFVGNYYNGPNNGNAVGTPLLARFFNINAAYNEGLTPFYSGTPGGFDTDSTDIPASQYNLSHPLNAEVHDIRIYNTHRTLGQINQDRMSGPTSLTHDLLFYLPVFFVRETRTRNVLQTPFKAVRTSTDDPFNVALSFGVAGRQINLPNFTREFVRNEYPRLFFLTGTEITSATTALPANTLLYTQDMLAKGNLTVLPNDNGKFTPNFSLLRTGSSPDQSPPISGTLTDKFQNDDGVLRYDFVSLNDLVMMSSYNSKITPFESSAVSTGSISAALQGATPEDPGLEKGPLLTVLDRTRDPSSNEVSFFDVSNLFYGSRIMTEEFSVYDSGLTGSNGRVKMRLRDNGMGGLYRADAASPHAMWSTVGGIVYDEGIAVVTDPTAIFFGKDQFEVTMQGQRPLFVKEINVLAGAGTVNSSSNPNWLPLKPSDNENETADKFVYISHVNLHDDNFNIIGKASLAQPLVKRDSDKFLIRLKIDY
jgi:hypothetical protein